MSWICLEISSQLAPPVTHITEPPQLAPLDMKDQLEPLKAEPSLPSIATSINRLSISYSLGHYPRLTRLPTLTDQQIQSSALKPTSVFSQQAGRASTSLQKLHQLASDSSLPSIVSKTSSCWRLGAGAGWRSLFSETNEAAGSTKIRDLILRSPNLSCALVETDLLWSTQPVNNHDPPLFFLLLIKSNLK